MDKEKEDRIGSLPDCLLLEIISRLEVSTKEVIKTTSTISKRWQHLWTQLPTLLFIDKYDVTDPSYYTDLTDYFSFIDTTLTQCPTNVKLNKFKLRIKNNSQVYNRPTSWIRHAITRNVQEFDLKIARRSYGYTANRFTHDDELFFNNSCLTSMKLSCCVFNPPNAAIRWDKLKFLCIEDGELNDDLIKKILSGSPCLETLELDCYIVGRLSKSLFGNFGVERLSCDTETYKWFTNGDELDHDDLGSMSMKLSRCVFNPPNGWDNLNFLCIDDGKLDEDLIRKILSGSPCLETLELDCYIVVRFSKSLFGNFGVERLSCDTETYKWFTNGDELDRDDLGSMSMKLSRCVFNPPNGWDNLKFLCISWKLDENLIRKILSGSPCLETLELNKCYGVRRIDIASKSVKNLVLSNYGRFWRPRVDTIEINAPYILSLTIRGVLTLEKILLLNVSFLVKADLRFWLQYSFARELGRDQGDIEDELLQGLLSSLGHVKEVAFGDDCLQVLYRLKKRGFQFPKSLDVTSRGRYYLQPQIFLLIIISFFVFWVTMVSNLLAD